MKFLMTLLFPSLYSLINACPLHVFGVMFSIQWSHCFVTLLGVLVIEQVKPEWM